MNNRNYRSPSSRKGEGHRSLEPWDPRGEARKSSWSLKTLTVVGGFLVLVIVAGVVLGLLLNWYDDHSVDGGETAVSGGSGEITIESGMTASQIGTLLEEQGVIEDSADFVRLVTEHGTEAKLSPGKYIFSAGLSLDEVVDMIERGLGSLYKVTVQEGWSISHTKAHLDSEGKISGTEYESLTGQLGQFELPYLAGEQVSGVTTLEGLLFPETYNVPEGQGADALIKEQLLAFTNKTSGLPWEKASSVGLSPYEIVIVASIIEREVSVPAERPKVARVIYNRLAKGMPLGITATIRYAVNKWTGSLTLEELAVDSPYNTYIKKGLPPGPICSPGVAALQAALEPEDGNWLYYVLQDTTGNHAFTASEEEFERLKENMPEGAE